MKKVKNIDIISMKNLREKLKIYKFTHISMNTVSKENNDVSKPVKMKSSDIKENYLTIGQSSRLWVPKSDILKWEKEGKIKGVIYNDKIYYARKDISNCM